MGDLADDMYEHAIAEEAYYDYRKSNRIWMTGKNEEIHIREMKTTHIKNCIKRLQKKIPIGIDEDDYDCWLKMFQEELVKRG